MASAYTALLGLVLPVQGELQGQWGNTVNNELTSLLDAAIAGTTSLTTDTDTTLSDTDGASNQSRQAVVLWNPASGTVTRTITAPARSKTYVVINATGGTQSIQFVGAGPTTGVTILAGEKAVVAWNGSDFVKVSTFGGSPSFTNVTVTGTTTLSGLTASTALALNGSKEVVSVTNTGSGNNVLATSPTLTTPNLGTPSAVTLTNATGLPLTTGVTGTLPVANGGTNGTASPVAGAVAYGTGSAYAFTAAGTSNQVLISNGASAPTWSNLSSLGVTTFSAGTTGFTPSTATSGAVTLAGTLATTNGGTGLTSFTANGVVYASSTSALTTGSALTFDGTNLGVGTSSPSSFGKVVSGGHGYTASSQVGFAMSQATDLGTIAVNSIYTSDNAGFPSTYFRAQNALILSTNTANSPVLFSVNNTEQMRLTSTGLGIGTSSPSTRLDLYVSSNDGLRIRNGVQNVTSLFYNQTDGSTLIRGATDAGTGFLVFETGVGTERMRLDSSGNLGIGTSSPLSKLHVNGDIRTDGDIDLIGGAGTPEIRLYQNGGNWAVQNVTGSLIFRDMDQSADRVSIDASGNLGLGVTPSAWTSPWKSLDINNGGMSLGGTAETAHVSANAYNDGSWKYKITSIYGVSYYKQFNGEHSWYNAPSGTAGNAITFTQALTLTAAANLLLGGTNDPGGANALYIANTASVPGTPTSGGVLYVESGALKYKGSSGTVTTIANA